MKVFYGGEDMVTIEIAKKLIEYCALNLCVENIEYEDVGIRERGEAVKKRLSAIALLGNIYPVVFVIDSDGECVVEMLNNTCPEGWDSDFGSINIAIDEGESWLLADFSGFSKYFGVKVGDIDYDNKKLEVTFDYKTSLYIMNTIIPKSRKMDIRENLRPTPKAKKPATYNTYWIDYVQNHWNIDNAIKHSESLEKAVNRINKKMSKYLDKA